VYETAARLDADLLEQIRAQGVQINEPSRDAFLEASRSMYDDFASTVPGGADLIERAASAGSR
jgi:TRAP-type C4-dicarboxylate transport system substrate-binding protein